MRRPSQAQRHTANGIQSKPGEPLATQLNIRPIALEHILRDIGDVDRELVEKEFNKLSFTVLLDIHCICHMAHMQALADKAAARFGVQAAFVLGKYCGSGNELEKSLYECLPRVLRCNRFAQDQLQAKMDVRLFDEVKVLFYAYRDRMFKTPHKIVAFLGSCPGFAEEVALDAIRDKINTRRLGCPRCGLWLKDLPLPYQSLKCTNCNASMSMETLLPSQGGDGSVYLKFTDLVHSTQALGPQAPPQGSIGALQPPRAPLATTPSWYALQASGLHQCKHIYPVTRRQCDTVFGNAHDLARHKNMLHGKEGASHCQYCWQCGEVRMFSRHDDLMRHVASVHPEEQPVPSIEHGQ